MIRRALFVAIGLGAITAIGIFIRTPQGTDAPENPPQPSTAQELLSQSEAFVALSESFPGVFDEIVAEVETAKPRGELAVANTTAQEMRKFMLRQGQAILGADDTMLQAVLHRAADSHIAVLDLLGEEACGRFALSGGYALGQALEDQRISDPLNSQVATTIRAIASGQNQEARRDAVDEDWGLTLNAAATTPQTEAYLDLVGAQDMNAPGYCEALIWTLRTIADAENPEATFVRGSLSFSLLGIG